jgi:hypothetical protein
MDIACRKEHSLYGNPQATDVACPVDPGAYHAGGTTCREGDESCQIGWEGNDEASLLGCALAIAYKPTAEETKPEDFIVMSVQDRCVRERATSFQIPSNLPACPEGGCTCGWFWSGKNSDPEMYMNGFRCDVQGGAVVSSYPTPGEPTKGSDLSGPTQPFYWGNSLNNIGYQFAGGIEGKPTYNAAYGWKVGAQEGAFAGVAGAGGAGAGNTQSIANSTNNVADPAAPAPVAPIESGSAPDAGVTGSMTTMESDEPDARLTGAAGGNPGPDAEQTSGGEPEASIPTATGGGHPQSRPSATGGPEDSAPPSDLNLGGGQASVGGPGSDAEPTGAGEYGGEPDDVEPTAAASGSYGGYGNGNTSGNPTAEYPARPSSSEAAADGQQAPPVPFPSAPQDGAADGAPAVHGTGCTMTGGGRGGGRGGRGGNRWGPDQASQTGAAADAAQTAEVGEMEYEKRGHMEKRRSRTRRAHA